MKDKIQKLIAEIIGDGFTVEVKPVAVKPVSGSVYSVASVYGAGVIDESSVLKPVSGGNVSSDFGAGVTTYLSVYTDGEGDQAIYVNGKLESHDTTIYGPDVVRVADGRLVRMRSALLDESLDDWPENESKLKELSDGYQSGVTAKEVVHDVKPIFDAIVNSGLSKQQIRDELKHRGMDIGNVSSVEGAPHGDCLVLRSEWNAKEGCFEDSRVEPEKYSEWEPKIDGWVRLPEGKVAKVKCVKIVNGSVLYGFHGTNIMYTLGALKPWTPSVGDKVVVNKLGRIADGKVGVIVECVEGDAGEYAVRLDRENLTSFNLRAEQLELIEPAKAPADHIPDATKKVPGDLLVDTTVKLNNGSRTVPSLSGWTLDVDPDAYIGMLTTQVASTMPNGWMVLHPDAKTEPRAVGDRFFRVTKGHWEELTEANIEQANAQSWAAIRKIPSVVLESQELLGSKVEYREPTNDDIGKRVEVRDHETHSWIELQLVAILPPGGPQFCVEDKSANRAIWKHARIKAC